jgi:hypothetical protein
MTHQPKRDWQLEERKTLPEIVRETGGIKALQMLPMIQALAMASKMKG